SSSTLQKQQGSAAILMEWESLSQTTTTTAFRIYMSPTLVRTSSTTTTETALSPTSRNTPVYPQADGQQARPSSISTATDFSTLLSRVIWIGTSARMFLAAKIGLATEPIAIRISSLLSITFCIATTAMELLPMYLCSLASAVVSEKD